MNSKPPGLIGAVSRWLRGGPAKPASSKHIPAVSEPAADLIDAVREGKCFIFAGEELSRRSSMPTWNSFILGLIDFLYDKLLLSPEDAETARQMQRSGNLPRVVKALAKVALAHPDLLNEYAGALYRKPAALTDVHEALGAIAASGFLTPNLDPLLERVFRIPSDQVLCPAECAEAEARLSQRSFVAMKLRGVLHRPETLRVWHSEAQSANGANGSCKRFLELLLQERTIIFVGTTMEEIEAWLAPASLSKPPARRHYALLTKSADHTLKRSQALASRYNIQCMLHPPDDTSDVAAFLSKLAPSDVELTFSLQ